ncbi:MAG: PadR family transcriptional regulator [Ornithinimicrobium sp.]|uniref:PadR family transcriptional regulator n=1 Tax=Ornithinimicrobium sp. TaxID=1977084 RepID=UPI003D9B36E5
MSLAEIDLRCHLRIQKVRISTLQDPNLMMGRIMDVSDGAALVTVSLADGPLHPAAIIENVAQTAGRDLTVGTLYGILDRMIGEGLVVRAAPEGRRRPYELTGAGRTELCGYLAAMSSALQVGQQRLAQA